MTARARSRSSDRSSSRSGSRSGTAKVRTFLSGFCNPSHDEDSHGRCPSVVSGLMCRCSCHPHRTVTYPEAKGFMVECRCGWLKWMGSQDAADREGAAHVRARNKKQDDDQ